MRDLSSKKQKKYLMLIGIIAGVYLGMKFIVPLFIPFLFAGIIVMMIYPCVKWLHRKIKMNKGIAATIIMLLIGSLVFVLIWLLCAQLFEQIKNISTRIHIYERQLCHLIRCSCESVERTFGIDAVNFEALILKNVNDMADSLQADTFPNLMNNSFFYIKGFAEFIGALIIGLLDALPFIGTGIILIPWALIELVSGQYVNAVALLILFAVCALSREFLEPKLIGKKLGIYPIVIMIAIYVGIKLYGIAGIIMGPVSFLLMYELISRYMAESDTDSVSEEADS